MLGAGLGIGFTLGCVVACGADIASRNIVNAIVKKKKSNKKK